MSRKLRIKNFYSIYEPLEISLMHSAHSCGDYRTIKTLDDKAASKLVALVGANGSGKTNILKSLAFLQWFVGHSFSRLEPEDPIPVDRKSTRLNSSHVAISYAVFCLKKKKY